MEILEVGQVRIVDDRMVVREVDGERLRSPINPSALPTCRLFHLVLIWQNLSYTCDRRKLVPVGRTSGIATMKRPPATTYKASAMMAI